MSNETTFDFESMKDKALEQLRSGKSLYGKDGAFAPLLKSFLEAALEAEMDSHMDDFERSHGNRRNGKTSNRFVLLLALSILTHHVIVDLALSLSWLRSVRLS